MQAHTLHPIEATSDLPIDVQQDQDPFMIQQPSNRGKFSQVRDTWDRIHQQRYLQWQLGDSIETIATEQGVTYNAVKHSIQYCEARMPRAEVLAGRTMRLRLKAIAALADQYVTELQKLMSNENPFVRLKALEHIRRTVGIEQGALHVNTQVTFGSAMANGFSCEDRLARIRAAQEERVPSALNMVGPRLIEKQAKGCPSPKLITPVQRTRL